MKIFAFADEASPLLDKQIIAMKQNGLDGLEIRNVDHVNISDLSTAKVREVKARMDAAGLRVWSIGSPIGKIDIEKGDFATHVEKFKRTLEIAELLESENLRFFSFFIPKGKNPNDYKTKVIERLGVLNDLAKQTNITLCHENEKEIYGDVPERCLEIHKALPTIKAVFDPANFVQCGIDVKYAWELLSENVKYLHIKDALKNGNIVPAGSGDGEIAYILEKYRKNGGEHVTLEPHLVEFDGLAALERDDNKSAVGGIYQFETPEQAFQVATDSLKKLL